MASDIDMAQQPSDTGQGGPTFAENLGKARKIVQLLEQGDVDLETGAAMYKEACECLQACRDKLAKVRNEIELLNGTVMQADDFLQNDDMPF